MRFRWVALLTLWTFLSGPMIAVPSKGNRSVNSVEPNKRPVQALQTDQSSQVKPGTR